MTPESYEDNGTRQVMRPPCCR